MYCYKVKAKTENDLLYKIRELYSKLISNGTYDEMNKAEIYGVSFWNNNEYIYCMGSTKKFDNSEKFIIPKNKYAAFNIGSRKQKNILEVEELIYSQWSNSTKYKILDGFDFDYIKMKFAIYIYL